MKLIIEKAQKKDLPLILDIQKKAFGEVARVFHLKSMPQLEQTLESITDEFDKWIFLNASIDEKIIGSVRAYKKDDTCYIHRLVVLPEYQNKGIGKALMAEVEKRFKDKVARYELFTGSRDQRNLYFYPKLGYKIIKTEKHNEEISFVYMEKIIKE
ncbi:MAG: GNAT family N-acetyltransferase [Syntrophaceae bacterium]|nr:GNAT family N-acetyltransferase [Syntrophaceae bacterium]